MYDKLPADIAKILENQAAIEAKLNRLLEILDPPVTKSSDAILHEMRKFLNRIEHS